MWCLSNSKVHSCLFPPPELRLFLSASLLQPYHCVRHTRGGFHIDVVVYVSSFSGAISRYLVCFHQRWSSPNDMNWVYFEQIMVKSTQFEQNWVLFFRNWCTDGWVIVWNWVRETGSACRSTYNVGKSTPSGKSESSFGISNFPVMCIWWMTVVSPFLPDTKSVAGWGVGD